MVVAGGGTGGHLFPGIAIAQSFKAMDPANEVLFVNAGRPLEMRVLSEGGWNQESISIEGIKGRGWWNQLKAALKIPGAVCKSWSILRRFKADVVLSVGGYSAGPVTLAAALQGIPTVAHEQNRLPGITTRILGRIVDRIYLSFDESREYFDSSKVKVCGNPVRDEIISLSLQPITSPEGSLFTIFVLGGSQGAQAINLAVADAIGKLKSLEDIRFIHQTGIQDEDQIKKMYAELGANAQVRSFFNDMAEQYRKADMIVCRAGATTVAEITVAGKAAVFVPFPFATDDHQTQNAQTLADAGAAEMIRQDDLNGDVLAKLINGYIENRVLLVEMAAKARALGRPQAARDIVDDMFKFLTK